MTVLEIIFFPFFILVCVFFVQLIIVFFEDSESLGAIFMLMLVFFTLCLLLEFEFSTFSEYFKFFSSFFGNLDTIMTTEVFVRFV